MGRWERYPYDSLLQSPPEFESESKANPIITQEHTSTIENMIKLCVLGEDWDDIIPHAPPDVGSRRGGRGPGGFSGEIEIRFGLIIRTRISKEGHEI